MTPFLVTWIGDFPSTVDGRVVQVTMTNSCNTEEQAKEFALELCKSHINVQVTIWKLHEALPYRCEGTSTQVEEM